MAIAAGTPGRGFVFACACFGTTGVRGVWAGANRDPSGGTDGRLGGGVGKQLAWVVGVVGGLRGEFGTGEVGRDFVLRFWGVWGEGD